MKDETEAEEKDTRGPGARRKEQLNDAYRRYQSDVDEFLDRCEVPKGIDASLLRQLVRDDKLRTQWIEFLSSSEMLNINDVLTRMSEAHQMERETLIYDRTVKCGGSNCTQELLLREMRHLDLPGARGFSLCPTCYAIYSESNGKRLRQRGIRSALSRARSAKLPATLSPAQWSLTLRNQPPPRTASRPETSAPRRLSAPLA